MLAEAFQKILDMAKPATFTVNGISYSSHHLTSLPSPLAKVDLIEMHTLSGFCRYLNEKLDSEIATGCAVVVNSPELVTLTSQITGDFNERQRFAIAKPFASGVFPFARYMDLESFVVGLQANFVPDETTAAVLQVLGNVKSENVMISQDDGVTQSVEARTGIARLATVSVPNPVKLRPYRTFQEVEQPASEFVLRIKKGDEDEPITAALFESTSDQWKVAAINSIREYIEKNAKCFLVLA